MPIKLNRDFRQDVEIDKYALEEECSNHPSVYVYWAEKLAEAKAESDALKNELDFISGEKELELRKNPPDGMKITEAVISALLSSDPPLAEGRRRLEESRKQVNIIQAAVQALEHKRAMLDNLRHLTIAGYYARPEGTRKQTTGDEAAAEDSRKNLKRRSE